MKILFIVLSLFILFSCTKEKQESSYTCYVDTLFSIINKVQQTTHNYQTADTVYYYDVSQNFIDSISVTIQKITYTDSLRISQTVYCSCASNN